MGQFESDIRDFLPHYLKPGMVIFDVGANIGVYSLLCAKYVGESGAVHAFEPTPKTFTQLSANVALNGFAGIKLNRLAVGEMSASSTLYLYAQNAINSPSRQDWVGRPLGQIEVKTITLDEYISLHGVPGVDL